jgi:hypothetical protein
MRRAAALCGGAIQLRRRNVMASPMVKHRLVLGLARLRGLLPISAKYSLSTVPGVGVSANIKFPI